MSRSACLAAMLAMFFGVFAHGGCRDAQQPRRHVAPRPQFAPELEALITSMVDGGVVESEVVGMLGVDPPQWRRYQGLAGLATDQELLKLVDHANPVVRCYAFRAIAARNHPQTFQILVQHLSDTQIVRWFHGCVMTRSPVAEYMIAVATDGHEEFASGYALAGAQAALVDSLLMLEPKLDLR